MIKIFAVLSMISTLNCCNKKEVKKILKKEDTSCSKIIGLKIREPSKTERYAIDFERIVADENKFYTYSINSVESSKPVLAFLHHVYMTNGLIGWKYDDMGESEYSKKYLLKIQELRDDALKICGFKKLEQLFEKVDQFEAMEPPYPEDYSEQLILLNKQYYESNNLHTLFN